MDRDRVGTDEPRVGASPAGLSGTGRQRTWLTAGLIFFGCLAVYHVNGRNHPSVDTVAVPYTAWSLLRHGSLDLHYYQELCQYRGCVLLEVPNGRWFANRPLGAALAALPVLAPLVAFEDQPPRLMTMNLLGKLVGAASAAAAAVVFYILCRRIAPGAAWPATVLFAFGTSLWSTASQALWMHGPATFWVCCALWALLDLEERPGLARPALAGLALGLAFLITPAWNEIKPIPSGRRIASTDAGSNLSHAPAPAPSAA